MNKRSLQFLETLVNTPSPSGHESRGLRVWLDYVSQYADETYSDAYGNCVAVLNKGGGPRLMLAGHADEIGMTVNFIDDDGYVYVRRLGGTNPAITRAQRVILHSRKGPVKGVVGSVAPHLMRTDTGAPKVPKIHELFIDIGADSRKAAEKLVRVGDPITLNDQFELLRDDLVVARAFDNRVGTWAVAETLRLLKTGKAKLNAEVCVVANTMEEVGLFGARQIAYSLHPDVALVMDVTHGNCNHPEVIKRVEQVAKRLKINLQHEAISSTSGTDTDAVFWTRGGIPSGLISLPNRYMHSPVEVVSLKDLEQIPQLMAGFAKSLKKGEQFKVKI